MERTFQKSVCMDHRDLFCASVHFGRAGSWHFTALGPVLTGGTSVTQWWMMEDQVCAIRPSPVPAGAQVSSGCRGWAPGCCRQQGLHRSEDKWLWSLLGLWPLILSMGSVNPLQVLLFKSSLFTSLNLPPVAGPVLPAPHTGIQPLCSSQELWCFPWWPQRFMCCWGLAFPMSFCLPLQCLWHSGMCPQERGWRHWGLQEHCDTSTIWNRSDRSLFNYD